MNKWLSAFHKYLIKQEKNLWTDTELMLSKDETYSGIFR